MLPAIVALKYGIKGWVSAPSASSASGSVALGEAYRMIKDGYMDRVLVGGLDLNVNRTVVNGMDAFGAVTKFDGPPELASRPFDQARSGTMISDGGALILLETQDSASQRGVKRDDIYGEMSGFGLNCDAFHALRPTDSGVGLVAAI